MNVRLYAGLIAAVSAATLILATNASSAGPGIVHAGGPVSSRPAFRPSAGRSLHHHWRGNGAVGAIWPDAGVYAPTEGGPVAEVPPQNSGDVHYTYTQDFPWDAVHRYPPMGAPYVPDCPAQNVTVPGRGGKDQTITITRCY